MDKRALIGIAGRLRCSANAFADSPDYGGDAASRILNEIALSIEQEISGHYHSPDQKEFVEEYVEEFETAMSNAAEFAKIVGLGSSQ